MQNINFTDYDRITDTLLFFNNNLTLNFTTVMARQDKTGNRISYHLETEYNSKYIGVDKARSIKRNINYYYTIDNRNDFGNGFILRQSDVAVLCMIIQQKIIPWFFGNTRIYGLVEDGNKLVIKNQYEPVIYSQSEYKFLKFEPLILSFEEGTFKEGIRITVNSDSEYADIDIDRFLGFYHLLKNTDMYNVACSMLTYVKTPPYGTNVYTASIGLGGGRVPDNNWNSGIELKEEKNNNRGNGFLDRINKK